MIAVIFYLAALTTIVGAVGVVTARNPIHSAMFLVMALMSIAVHYVLLGADLAAAVQVIVYASAVVILFLFVIMLLGVDRPDEDDDIFSKQRLVAFAVAVMFASTLLLVGGTKWATGARSVTGELEQEGLTNIEIVAQTLFTKYAAVFELTAILLVAAVVGAVVLARRATTTQDLIDADAPDDVRDSSEVV
jgi:NADH-quinone oxidoreductase subunit J